MKLSTRIKKYVDPVLLWGDGPRGDHVERVIVFWIDCARNVSTHSLEEADLYHEILQKNDMGHLLPKECPVVSDHEITIHYTSTTYKDWKNIY